MAGHITEKDFGPAHRTWHSCDPGALFDAPIESKIPPDKSKIKDNLLSSHGAADLGYLDRPATGREKPSGPKLRIYVVVLNPNIVVRRAKFSAIIAQCVMSQEPRPAYFVTGKYTTLLSILLIWIWHKRMQWKPGLALDLRIGAAFTRMQTLRLQQQFRISRTSSPIGCFKSIIFCPYTEGCLGPCNFQPWDLLYHDMSKSNLSVRSRFGIFISLSTLTPTANDADGSDILRKLSLFGPEAVYSSSKSALRFTSLYFTNPMAQITSVRRKPTKKWKPLP